MQTSFSLLFAAGSEGTAQGRIPNASPKSMDCSLPSVSRSSDGSGSPATTGKLAGAGVEQKVVL